MANKESWDIPWNIIEEDLIKKIGIKAYMEWYEEVKKLAKEDE